MLQRAGHDVRLTGLDALVPGVVIVIYQRSYTEAALRHIGRAKAADAVTVYETDDDMIHIAPNNPAAPFFQGKLRAADATLTTTTENAAWMGQNNPRVHVMPNMFAFRELRPLPATTAKRSGSGRWLWCSMCRGSIGFGMTGRNRWTASSSTSRQAKPASWSSPRSPGPRPVRKH